MSLVNKTFISVANFLKEKADKIKEVNDSGIDFYFDFNASTTNLYPYILIHPDMMDFSQTNVKEYRFYIIVMDRLFQDKSNKMNVLNDTSEILNEYLITLLNKNRSIKNDTDLSYNIIIDENATIWTEKYDDYLSGITQLVKIKVNQNNTICNTATK